MDFVGASSRDLLGVVGFRAKRYAALSHRTPLIAEFAVYKGCLRAPEMNVEVYKYIWALGLFKSLYIMAPCRRNRSLIDNSITLY